MTRLVTVSAVVEIEDDEPIDTAIAREVMTALADGGFDPRRVYVSDAETVARWDGPPPRGVP